VHFNEETGMAEIGIGFNSDVPVHQMMTYAKLSENSGLESFWMHEHSFGRDALSYLISAAQTTKRIKLGVACLSPYTRHPVLLAMSMATLQEESGGRAILGIGTGFPMRLDSLGIRHDKPIGALKDTIEICRRIWSGESLSYKGSSFNLKNVKSIAPKPERKIPIYIAGWKKQMLTLTGRYADGYVAKGGESIKSLARLVDGIRTAAESTNRSLSEIRICAYLLTIVSTDKKTAQDQARKDPFVNYMLSVQDDYLFEESGIPAAKKKPIAENYFKGRLDESWRYVSDEMLDAFTVCGTSQDIDQRIAECRKSGLNLPILQPISMKDEDVLSVINATSTFISSKS
jgi:5,10-methylenetetrahydromethanopterin reductase